MPGIGIPAATKKRQCNGSQLIWLCLKLWDIFVSRDNYSEYPNIINICLFCCLNAHTFTSNKSVRILQGLIGVLQNLLIYVFLL